MSKSLAEVLRKGRSTDSVANSSRMLSGAYDIWSASPAPKGSRVRNNQNERDRRCEGSLPKLVCKARHNCYDVRLCG
eukprot:3934872-Amphidinium_carterae.1